MSRIPAAFFGLVLLVAAVAAGAHGVAAQEEITLTVSVVADDGDPVGGAVLNVTWANGSTTEETASNGKAFVDVPAGTNATIHVQHADYVRNDPYTVRNAEAGDVEVTVHPKGSLSVGVSDSNGAVADATVVVSKDGDVAAEGRTDGSGVFDTGVVEVGSYDVEVVKRGYHRAEATVDVDGDVSNSVTVERGSVVLAFNVSDPHFAPARPVAAAVVDVDGVGEFNTLDNGEASARVPVNSVLPLSVTKDAYETVEREVHVGESREQVAVNLSRAPLVNVTATSKRVVAGERVSVEVLDEYGDPIEGATVLLDGAAVGRTDAGGEYDVRLQDAGNHSIGARLNGTTAAPVTVEALSVGGETTTATATTTAATATTGNATTQATTDSGGMPGFTVGVALVALLFATMVAARRR